jgi:SAM-dependent methyltransferase
MLDDSLPAAFLADLLATADAYFGQSDPIRQSGFGGGAERWRAEREPILDAITRSGSFIDIGCANGYLLECLVLWGRERGLALDPHGLDYSPQLIELARTRLPHWTDHFFVGMAGDGYRHGDSITSTRSGTVCPRTILPATSSTS